MAEYQDSNKYKYYLMDLGYLLKEQAFEGKGLRAASRISTGKDFYSVQLIAYYAVFSLMQQKALAVDIPLEDLRLDDINPDRDLL